MAGVTRAKGFVVKRVREDVYKNCFSPPVALEATGFHVGPFDVGGTSADVRNSSCCFTLTHLHICM